MEKFIPACALLLTSPAPQASQGGGPARLQQVWGARILFEERTMAAASAASALPSTPLSIPSFFWLRWGGVEGLDNLRAQFTSAVRGLHASRDLQRGETIFSVPSTLFVDSASLTQRGLTHLARAHPKIPPRFHLYSALLEAPAAFKPYFDSVADVRVDNFPSWWLAFPAAYPRTLAYLNSSALRPFLPALEEWSHSRGWHVHGVMAKAYRRAKNTAAAARVCNPFALMRAVLLMESRYYAEDVKQPHSLQLVPVVELMNHAGGDRQNVDISVKPRTDGTDGSPWRIAVRARRDVRAGEELLDAYYEVSRDSSQSAFTFLAVTY